MHRSSCGPLALLSAILLPVLIGTTLSAPTPGHELESPEDVRFVAKLDGTEQRYVIRLPGHFNANEPHDLLIALHGHGSDRWQFANDGRDECRAARDAAAASNLIYVSPDYRAKTSWMGPAATADLSQIIDDLHRKFRIENVILCGGSMGGTSALAFAAMHPERVDGVVSMNGTANLVEYSGFGDAIAASYGGSKTEKPEVYKARSAELFPQRLTMPVGLTTGGKDTLVPPDSTLRLASHLTQQKSPVKLIHRPDGGHDTSYADAIEALNFVIAKTRPMNGFAKPLLPFDSKPQTVVCLGDSVTGVYYHTGGRRAYPEMLQLALSHLHPEARITVINAGISGQTTQDGLNRLDQDVLSKNPDLVTISFGLNDVTRIPPDTFRSNLEALIRRCREHHSQVLLCTPNAVIDTSARPIEKLVNYCQIIRDVGRDLSVPVCDQYAAGTKLKNHAPWTWRLTMSDEIHPNMDGHKRMAEELCRSITGKPISLDPIGPPRPQLPHIKALIQQQKVIRVLAMSPYDAQINAAIKGLSNDAQTEVTTWSVAEKTMPALEQEANQLVRAMKPDLVILAVPRGATAESDEQFVRSYSWIMNWSLSFGHQEWDCLVIHPSVTNPSETGARDELFEELTRAQDLDLVQRPANNSMTSDELLRNWFEQARK